MWEGHVEALKQYHDTFLQWCEYFHKIKTTDKSKYFADYTNKLIAFPWWLGNEDFHRAMRAKLIEKDEAFYYPKFPDDEWFNGAEYL